eukprot:GHVU01110979.1.p1 GENE.GHVU01110979.1~~GHVU01110979.1.p1  ORF type:complete len:399 (+),score=94.20 GHVU01110979.1:3-1199(+)
MLCDRPTTKAGGRAAADSGMTMPFACAVGPGSKYEALGLNPSREQRAAKLASDNKTRPRDTNDFMSKHKQWLSRLNQQRRMRAEEDQQAVQVAIEKTKKFKEYATKLRANIREAKDQHAEGYLSQEALEEHTVKSMGSGKSSKPPSQSGPKKGKSRPLWAMTEEGVEDAEDEELDQLLNFANNLDYDKYVEDYEVRNALAAVKNRISELAQGKARLKRTPGAGGEGEGEGEGEIDLDQSGEDWKKAFVAGWNGSGDDDGRLGTARSDRSAASHVSARSMRSHRSGMGDMDDDNISVADSMRSDRDVSMEVAEQVLNSSRSMRRVHSSRSIRGILERKTKPRGGGLAAVGEDEEVSIPTVAPPVNQVYDKEDQGVAGGGGKKKGVDPSNLPYLHRNPAI